ncbi:hypothetical protein [Ruegeria faecimaris]|uniref:Uncharacterized protein n=2 Tax=Ruegeria faecimaris TaxID=686389 RepID=A0A521CHX6_9RHOB|nr:hypothetical protein [Ruegeria faecimaris]SMO59057.1 hypothetical protein SAMN06265380_10319 [Ruegeria faecimaris]
MNGNPAETFMLYYVMYLFELIYVIGRQEPTSQAEPTAVYLLSSQFFPAGTQRLNMSEINEAFAQYRVV